MKLGFIGAGNMATAMIGGILKEGIVTAEQIMVSECVQPTLESIKQKFSVQGTGDNMEIVKNAQIIVLAVKPQVMEQVIGQIAPYMQEDQVIVSIAPGKTLAWFEAQFGRSIKIVRCMPNTPALVGEGCTGVCKSDLVTAEEMESVMRLLRSFGKAIAVPESQMDVVVGVSGSAPAYVFLFIEAMADAAVAAGMPRGQAYEFSAQAVLGSAKMVLETGKHPGELKDMVCSPGGTTIEAVRVLEEKGMRSAVIEAVGACIDKSRKL